MGLGIIIKNNYKLAFLIGICWEVFEYIITTNNYTRKLLIKYWYIKQEFWDETNILNRVFDIVFNMVGYYVGNKMNLHVIIKK